MAGRCAREEGDWYVPGGTHEQFVRYIWQGEDEVENWIYAAVEEWAARPYVEIPTERAGTVRLFTDGSWGAWD